MEDLNVKGMVRNKHLAYDISDAGIGMFYTLLAYKCLWYGTVEMTGCEPVEITLTEE